MRSFLLRFTLILSVVFVVISCARTGSPAGGEKDTVAPKIVSSYPENGSIRFDAKEVEFTFDEYVKLNNIQQQLVVSPALEEAPEFRIKKRSIIMELKSPLAPNTTYNFNFGDAIVDVNEGNALKGFSFVVSTGDYIDSLQIHGVVINAYSGAPAKDFTAMLYDTSAVDSSIYLKRPLYISKTDDKGEFTLKNLKVGEYKLIALNDINKDFKFQAIEDIAFVDSLIPAGLDSNQSILLKAFKEYGDNLLMTGKKLEDQRKLTIGLNQPCYNCRITEPASQQVIYKQWKDKEKDTLFAQLRPVEGLDSITFYVYADTGIVDTAQFYPSKAKKKGDIVRKKFSPASQNPDAEEYLKFTFDEPIVNLETAGKVTIKQSDSTFVQVALFADTAEQNIYYLDYKPAPEEKFVILWPDSNFTTLYGSINGGDTAGYNTEKLEYYGNLIFNIDNKLEDQAILLITDTKTSKVKSIILDKGKNKVELKKLPPTTFVLSVILDENRNGKWDPGKYLKAKQAEKVINYKESVQVRSNWDLELDWVLDGVDAK